MSRDEAPDCRYNSRLVVRPFELSRLALHNSRLRPLEGRSQLSNDLHSYVEELPYLFVSSDLWRCHLHDLETSLSTDLREAESFSFRASRVMLVTLK